jgi:hypothetical protein
MEYWYLFCQALCVSSQSYTIQNSHIHSTHREAHTLICLKKSKKMTDRKSKNTKKQISLGHTITEYAKPLTSSHTQNTIGNNINSEEKQNCNTNIFNNCIKFKYH